VKGGRKPTAARADRAGLNCRLKGNPNLRLDAIHPLDTTNTVAFPAAQPGNIIFQRQRLRMAVRK
jgi:hypothetical protein